MSHNSYSTIFNIFQPKKKNKFIVQFIKPHLVYLQIAIRMHCKLITMWTPNLQGNVYQVGNCCHPGITVFVKPAVQTSYIFTNLQRILMRLHIFSTYDMINWVTQFIFCSNKNFQKQWHQKKSALHCHHLCVLLCHPTLKQLYMLD